MKRISALVLALCFIFTTVIPVKAFEKKDTPKITGEAAYLIDVKSGQTLFSKNGNKQLAPASTTKIMTGLLAIESGKLDETVTMTQTMLDYKTVYGTRIYLEPGESMLLSDLLYALLLNSANDAAVAIAEHLRGNTKAFAELMNKRAVEIGAINTNFVNPSGLTETGHYTTAHDLALIARAAYQNPIFAQYVKTKSYVIPRQREDIPTEMINENKLLWRNDTINGIKTGYTMAAGNCLVASASKDGRELIGVILKSPGKEIYPDMQNLLDYGFDNFQTSIYMDANSPVEKILINNEQIDLLLASPIWLTKDQDLKAPEISLKVIEKLSPLISVSKGEVISYLEVRYDGELLNTIPLVASKDISESTTKMKNVFSNSYFIFVLLGLILVIVGSGKFFKRKKYAVESDIRSRRIS